MLFGMNVMINLNLLHLNFLKISYYYHASIDKKPCPLLLGGKLYTEFHIKLENRFFVSLAFNPWVSFVGEPETDQLEKPFLTRFKNWGTGVFNWPCHGRRVRQICVLGIGDLPLLARRPEFFANKFYLYYQTYALQCMEELHFNRTRDEFLQHLDFVTDYYEKLEFIKHVV